MQTYNIIDSIKSFIHINQTDINLYVFYSLSAPIGDVMLPHFYGKVIDNLGKYPPSQTFNCNKTSICVIMVLWAIKQYLARSLDKLDSTFIPKLTSYFRNEIVEKILFYYEHRSEDPKVGELLAKIIRLPSIIRDLFGQIRTTILPNFLIMLFASGYMFYVNTSLGMLMLCGMALFIWISSSFIKDIIESVKKAHENYDSLHEEIIDILSNSTNIYSAGMVKEELENIIDTQKAYGNTLQNSIQETAKFKSLFSTCYFVMFMAVSYYDMRLYSQKKISIARATSVLIIILFCIMDLNDVSNSMRDFIFNIGGLLGMQKYLNEIFVDQTPIQPINSEVEVGSMTGQTPQNVSFFSNIYVNNVTIKIKDKTILKDYSCIFHKGKLNVIEAKVGFGKSTLLKSIMKIQPITSGSIYIGDISIQNIDTKMLRMNMAYVPQHINLFNRNVFDNIVYGIKRKVLPAEVTKMMQKYNIDEINENDFFRPAGKSGCNLSGGQKQIVLLLRALLSNSPIILLDEPTSALSQVSKNKVIEILQLISDGSRTIITTTHDKDLINIAGHHVKMDINHNKTVV